MKKPKKNINLDGLARMVAEGFNGVNDGFEGVNKQFGGVSQRFDKVDLRLKDLEEGQEQIKLRLDNVAYRFELQNRVKHLENKAGIRYR